MLGSLRHNTVGCGNNEDSTVHLSGASDHVLDVVGVTRAVNVSVVTFVGLILNVSGVDGNTSFSLFGSLVDVGITLELSLSFKGKILRDCSGKSGFTMVNVTDGTNVNVRLGSFKFSFCHWNIPP